MKKTVIAILGKSGVGKTTASLLFHEVNNDIQTLISLTTRKKRDDEEDFVDHYFGYSTYDFNNTNKEDIIASTVYGGYTYWTRYSDIKSDIFAYVIDEDGLNDLIKSDKFIIRTVLIVRDDLSNISKDRKDRDKNRSLPNINSFDYIIRNDGSKEELKEKISNVASHIVSLEKTRQELLNKNY